MEVEQIQPIEEQKEIPQESETTIPEPAKKDAGADESKEDWESLRFGLPEDECNETNYADWIANASAKSFNVTKGAITEIKSLANPPVKVANMYSIVYYILRKKNRAYEGKIMKGMFANPIEIVKEIQNFDYSTLTYKNCVVLKRKLEGESFEDTKKSSAAAAVLIDWALTLTKLRIVTGIYTET